MEWIKGVIDPIDFFNEFLKLDVIKKGLPFNNPRYWNPSIILIGKNEAGDSNKTTRKPKEYEKIPRSYHGP